MRARLLDVLATTLSFGVAMIVPFWLAVVIIVHVVLR